MSRVVHVAFHFDVAKQPWLPCSSVIKYLVLGESTLQHNSDINYFEKKISMVKKIQINEFALLIQVSIIVIGPPSKHSNRI